MRSAIDSSRAVHFNKEGFKNGDVKECEKAISHHHAFYLATLGGAKGMQLQELFFLPFYQINNLFVSIVLSMDDKIGNFLVSMKSTGVQTLSALCNRLYFREFQLDVLVLCIVLTIAHLPAVCIDRKNHKPLYLGQTPPTNLSFQQLTGFKMSASSQEDNPSESMVKELTSCAQAMKELTEALLPTLLGNLKEMASLQF